MPSSTSASTTMPSRWPSCAGCTTVSLERFQPFVACLAGRHDPVGLIDRDEIEARIEAFRAERAPRRA